MSAKVRVEVDPAGLADLLTTEEVRDDVQRRAEAVASAARHFGVRVEGVPGDVPLPVEVLSKRTGPAESVVILDHPAGLAVEAKHRLLAGSLDAARR